MTFIRNRGVGFALGALAFAGAHAVEAAMWTAWFGGAHAPWFLNSGKAAAVTIGGLFVVSLIGGVREMSGVMFAAGAFVAMTAILFNIEGGRGNIFPIVMVFGGVLILASSALGAWLGREIGGLVRGRR